MYAKIKDDAVVKFPYGVNELKIDNPYTNYNIDVDVFSMFQSTEQAKLHGFELVRVIEDTAPSYNFKTQKIEKSSVPVLVDSSWKLICNIINLTAEEQEEVKSQKEEEVREIRNKLLKDSDWTQGKDIPESISAPWAEYRAKLRDIPVQEGYPWEVDWPCSSSTT
jgi:hypothetical protein